KVLRSAVRKHNAVSGHSSPDSLVDDPYIAQWMDEYAERFAELTDPVWEKMINDPNNWWYREGREYQELFSYSRALESSGHR
ncbi:MAG: radical SAM protein, partial [Flexistipes sinusarabici]